MHPIFTAEEASLLETSLAKINDLPPTPGVMVKLIELSRQPDHDIDEVVKLMGQDPALTAEVLRRCNSSFFGAEDPVNHFGEAVFRLGFYEVYRITVAMFAQNSARFTRNRTDLDLEALWRHSAVTAIVCSLLARELNESEGVLFTAGLLHDIGRIVLALLNDQRYNLLLREFDPLRDPVHLAERKLFGFDHAQAGAWLLHRWNLPPEVVLPVREHHGTNWVEESQRISAIVHLADLLSHSIDRQNGELDLSHENIAGCLKFLNLDSTAIQKIVILSRHEIQKLLPALSAMAKAG